MKNTIYTILLLFVLTPNLSSASLIYFNEIHYDNSGRDLNEFVEIAGPAGTSLSNWSIAFFNGTQGNIYKSIALNGVINDYGSGFGVAAFNLPGIQNGPRDGIALFEHLGTTSRLAQLISYEGSFVANESPAKGITSQDIGIEQPPNTPVGYSLQLAGHGDSYQEFTWRLGRSSFNQPNAYQTFATSKSIPEPNAKALFAVLILILSFWQYRKMP